MDTAETSAQIALREATRALSVERDGTDADGLNEAGYEALAADLAANLDAVARLLRSVGVGSRSETTAMNLHAVTEQVNMSALMARQASDGRDLETAAGTESDGNPPAEG
jgi:hypothetical protein